VKTEEMIGIASITASKHTAGGVSFQLIRKPIIFWFLLLLMEADTV
jgi:hypothetical protein